MITKLEEINYEKNVFFACYASGIHLQTTSADASAANTISLLAMRAQGNLPVQFMLSRLKVAQLLPRFQFRIVGQHIKP